MANSSEASVSKQLGAVLPNLAWLLADTKIETNCMCSHVIFIIPHVRHHKLLLIKNRS